MCFNVVDYMTSNSSIPYHNTDSSSPATPIPIQFPANVPVKAVLDGLSVPLPYTWEMWMQFRAPGFSLATEAI